MMRIESEVASPHLRRQPWAVKILLMDELRLLAPGGLKEDGGRRLELDLGSNSDHATYSTTLTLSCWYAGTNVGIRWDNVRNGGGTALGIVSV